jgi:hypothetical protein
MEEDDDDQGRLRIMPPTYIYPDRPVKYHGAGMTKALKKLRARTHMRRARPRRIRVFELNFSKITMLP